MAEESWPSPAHNDRVVTDLEYEQIASRFSDDGVYGDPDDAAVVTAGTGLSVTIRPGVHASVRGHTWTSGTTTVTLPVDPNPASLPRRDWVVLRLDRSTWTVRAAVKPGVPSVSQRPPVITQETGDTGVYEIPLALVQVPAGAASVTVTRHELYVGGRFRPSTSSTLDPRPRVGDGRVETDTGRVLVWNGMGWVVVYSRSGVVTINSSVSVWSNEVDSVLEERTGTVHLRLGAIKRTGGPLAADIESRLPVLIPDAYQHATRDQYGSAYITGGDIARFIVYGRTSSRAGQVWLVNKPRIETGDNILPMSGMSWVVDD